MTPTPEQMARARAVVDAQADHIGWFAIEDCDVLERAIAAYGASEAARAVAACILADCWMCAKGLPLLEGETHRVTDTMGVPGTEQCKAAGSWRIAPDPAAVAALLEGERG